MTTVDTHSIIDSGITAASRGTVMGAQSVKKGWGRDLSHTYRYRRPMMFKAPGRDSCVLEDGFFKLSGVPDAMIPWQGSVRMSPLDRWSGRVLWLGTKLHTFTLTREKGCGDGFPTYTYTLVVSEVEIDTETGEIKVERITSAHDCGTVVNPKNLVSQIHSGVVMGIGVMQ